MKLIIDISKEYYEVIKEIPNDTSTADMMIIKYGKPFNKELQEIRQEITNEAYTKQCFDSDMYDYEDKAIDLDDVYAIIDEHIKEIEGNGDE